MTAVEEILDAAEECPKCDTDTDDDEPHDLCDGHQIRLNEARRVEDARNDPQRNRVGVRGDPTPDHEYGDRR